MLNHYKDYVLFDLETTGFSLEKDEIIEIAALKVVDNEIVAEFSTLVNPGVHIPFYASRVNHITDDMVKDAPPMKQVLTDFLAFVGDAIVIGHNIKRFDVRLIQRDSVRFCGKPFSNDCVDTLFLAQQCLPKMDKHSLGDLALHYNISYEGAHRALTDCHINKLVYDSLINEAVNISLEPRQNDKCPRCGSGLIMRSGKYGDFLGCTNYPNCKYTLSCK